MVEHTFASVEHSALAYTEQLLAVDPALLPGDACERLVQLVARVERVEAVVRSRLVKRATEANRWRAAGHRSPDQWLAASTGTTVGQARAALELAEDLAGAPETERALAAGVLSPEQAAEVAAAAKVDAAAEQRLLVAAQRESLTELRRRARGVVAAATDEVTRREAIRRGRHIRWWTDAAGAFCFAGRGLPEDGARLVAALRPLQDGAFDDASVSGEREPAEAYAYDALMALVTTPGGGDGDVRAPAKILLHVDLAAMRRGHTLPGERCEIAGIGPVAVAVARDLLGDAFLALVVSDGVDVRNVTHLGRAPTAHQRTALEARGMTCEVPGCGRTTRLEVDHVDGWAVTRRTHIDQLAWLCGGVGNHHHQKTHDGYTLTGPPGDRRWLPP